jgi:LysM repeat protein
MIFKEISGFKCRNFFCHKKSNLYNICIATFIFLFLLNGHAYSQTPAVEVERSDQKVLVEGKAYFLHTVKKGQTLYSIARAYQCTVNDIINNNPSIVNEDIKVDQILKIPVNEKPEKLSESKDVIHSVLPGQTLFSISRMYGISVDEIKSANHLLSDTLKANQQLVIPVNKNEANAVSSQPATNNYVTHKVIENETLYSLSKRYGVSIDQIIAANPEQKDGLKLGAEIKIPVKYDSLTIEAPARIACDSVPSLKGKSLSISLLLPFFASYPFAIEDQDEQQEEKAPVQKKEENFPPSVMNYLEFYQGVLLALDDLKKEGINIELNVYDTEKGKDKIKKILKLPAFSKSNLIIGPAFSDQIPEVAGFAAQKNIPIVVPFVAADSLNHNSFLFWPFSGVYEEITQIINCLSADSVKKIIFVYDKGPKSDLNSTEIQKIIDKHLNKNGKKIINVNIDNNDFKTLLNKLDTGKVNHVVCFSSDEIFVTSCLGQLETRLLYYPVHTYGLSEWLAFKNIDLDYFYNQQLTCFSNFYVDYENEAVLKFLKKYRLLFETEPMRNSKYGFNYCMLGYDLVNFFVNGIATYANSFNYYNCLKYPALITKFRFYPLTGGGNVNTSFFRIQYSNNLTFTIQ